MKEDNELYCEMFLDLIPIRYAYLKAAFAGIATITGSVILSNLKSYAWIFFY